MKVTHQNQQYKVSRESQDEWRLTSVAKPRESITLSSQQMRVAGFGKIVEAKQGTESEMEKAYEEYFESLAEGEEALSFAEFREALL